MYHKSGRDRDSRRGAFAPAIAFALLIGTGNAVTAEPVVDQTRLVSKSLAVSAQLDESFADNGVWTTTLASGERVISRDLHVTRAGKIRYVGGLYDATSSANSFWFASLTSAGAVDSAFGAGGAARFTPPGNDTYFDQWYGDPSGAYHLSSNRFTGLSGPGSVVPMLGRLTSLGVPDNALGGNGWRDPAALADAYAWRAMLPLHDGSLLGYFQMSNGSYKVARFDSNGELIALNGQQAQVDVAYNLGLVSRSRFVQTSNGYVYLITDGALESNSPMGVRVHRFRPDLRLDEGYGGPFIEWPLPAGFQLYSGWFNLHPLADGGLIISNVSYEAGDMDQTWFTAIKLDQDGRLDTSYGNNGAISYYPVFGNDIEPSLTGVPAVAQDGSLFAVMTIRGTPIVVAFDASGELIETFGSNGEQAFTFCRDGNCFWQGAWKAAITPSGQVVVSTDGGMTQGRSGQPLVFALKGFDGAPDAFTFPDGATTALNAWVESAPVQPDGYDGSTSVWVDNGEFTVSDQADCSNTQGDYSSVPGGISPGQWLCVRVRSANTAGNRAEAVIQVGSTTSTFGVTVTPDSEPDAFEFASASNVSPDVSVESDEVTLAGFNVPLSISVEDGEFRVNGGTYQTTQSTVMTGDVIQVRQRSAAGAEQVKTTSLTVGAHTATFSTKTKAQPSEGGGGGGSVGLLLLVLIPLAVARRQHR